MVKNKQGALNPDCCGCRCIHQERVTAAHDQALPPQDNARLAELLKAMADGNRLRILWALAEGEMCVCDLALYLGVSASAVSHQLRLLRGQRLVTNRREGPVLYYRLHDDHVTALINVGLEHVREERS